MASDRLAKELEEFAKHCIEARGCTCNEPNHRCGTNQMLDDLDGLVSMHRDPLVAYVDGRITLSRLAEIWHECAAVVRHRLVAAARKASNGAV